MATYGCPRQRCVSIGEHLEGYGVVLGADDIPAELRLDGTMSITEELRKYANCWEWVYAGSADKVEDQLLEIADCIDAAHERELMSEYSDGAQEVMSGDGYIELPKDADGVPIRIGDKVTEHEDGHTFKVDGFMDWGGEWWVFMRDGVQAPASRCTHYRTPTVEDVLTELEGMRGGYATYEDVVMRCAELAKTLREVLQG